MVCWVVCLAHCVNIYETVYVMLLGQGRRALCAWGKSTLIYFIIIMHVVRGWERWVGEINLTNVDSLWLFVYDWEIWPGNIIERKYREYLCCFKLHAWKDRDMTTQIRIISTHFQYASLIVLSNSSRNRTTIISKLTQYRCVSFKSWACVASISSSQQGKAAHISDKLHSNKIHFPPQSALSKSFFFNTIGWSELSRWVPRIHQRSSASQRAAAML